VKSYLIDTNVLLRAIQRQDHLGFRSIAREAIKTLHRRGESLCLCAQNLIEFWSVATRPENANGLGMNTTAVERTVLRCESFFQLLPESADIFPEWKRLVTVHQVTGVKVHDARLVAAMNVHAVPRIVTFDVVDFKRYPIEVIHPANAGSA
jgi:predicted nucleic acid-binding protein